GHGIAMATTVYLGSFHHQEETVTVALPLQEFNSGRECMFDHAVGGADAVLFLAQLIPFPAYPVLCEGQQAFTIAHHDTIKALLHLESLVTQPADQRAVPLGNNGVKATYDQGELGFQQIMGDTVNLVTFADVGVECRRGGTGYTVIGNNAAGYAFRRQAVRNVRYRVAQRVHADITVARLDAGGQGASPGG